MHYVHTSLEIENCEGQLWSDICTPKIEGIITKAIDTVAYEVYSYSSYPFRREINMLNAFVNFFVAGHPGEM
jgi:hypothetical protein